MIPKSLSLCKGMAFLFARDVGEVIDAALQPLGGDKPIKAVKSGARLKTMETAPPSPDIVASVPSSA